MHRAGGRGTGRPVHIRERREIPAGPGMVVCQLQKSPGVVVTITGTFSENSFGQMNEEFERIIRSVEFR